MEIRKAEELANWEFVKDRSGVQDLRDHLARFPRWYDRAKRVFSPIGHAADTCSGV
jgi:hypothetical protein